MAGESGNDVASDEALRTAIDTAIDGIALLDADGEYVYVNQAHADIYGYDDPAAFHGNHWRMCYPDSQLPYFEEEVLPALESNDRWRGEATGIRADGTRFPQELTLSTLGDGGMVCVVRDITVRKEREGELQARATAMEASIDGMAILDENERYTYVNQAHADVYGYDGEEAFLGNTWHMCYGEDELARFEEEVLPVIREEGAWRGEAIGRRKDGATFPQELSLTATDGGGLVCVVRDVTERKEYERELERQNERLDNFAEVVSHDLRNPLNVAAGQLERARADAESDAIEEVAWALDCMDELIDDLLTLAREGRRVSDLERVDLQALTETCWRHVDTSAATLETDLDGPIRADRTRCKQLLENLLRNAIDHGGEGVTITVGELDDGFYVADDGPGIPEEQRNAIFQWGYTTSADGTGFGLTIVSEIAEAHGWDVAVAESEAGGARIEITGVETAEN